MTKAREVSATSCADHESPEAAFCRSRWRRLAQGVRYSNPSSDIGSDLPLPRRGVLSGKSSRTSRRWRLFFVRFVRTWMETIRGPQGHELCNSLRLFDPIQLIKQLAFMNKCEGSIETVGSRTWSVCRSCLCPGGERPAALF